MPQLGEIKKSPEIGKGNRSGRYVWQSCNECGKERWVQLSKVQGEWQPVSLRCNSCANKGKVKLGSLNPAWRGGHRIDKQGYIETKLYPDDFFFPMAKKSGYVMEHRLVLAKHLGRSLLPFEQVHHLGTRHLQGSREDKSDNRVENLELTTKNNHTKEHSKGYSKGFHDGFRKGYEDGKNLAFREMCGKDGFIKMTGKSYRQREKNDLPDK